MPADPVELQILSEIRSRLEQVTVANGYHTDAGLNLHLGRIIDEDNDTLPALAVVFEEAPVTNATMAYNPRTRLTITVQGVVRVDDESPMADTIKVVHDIKRALHEGADLRLAPGAADFALVGAAHIPAEPGSSIAAGEVTLTVEFTERFTG